MLQDKLNAAVSRMAVAPNGRFVACFTGKGVLTVLSTNFRKKVLDFNTKSHKPPLQMAWCGEDSVILYWKALGLLMVGPFGDWLKYTYPAASTLHLVQEIDCARIISNDKMAVLQRVPGALEAIRKIGSTKPAAMLYDAMESFDNEARGVTDPHPQTGTRGLERAERAVQPQAESKPLLRVSPLLSHRFR